MGNSNRRASPRPSQSGAVWDEANVLRLISEHKLAPKYGDSSSGKRSFECPICFLDFGILNTVNCCKQHICTDCLVQVKGSTGKGACPFCGNAELNASLVPLDKDKPTSTPDNNPKSADDRSISLNSETERSSGGSTKALSYTTPEQEKKLRSYSLDDTTPSDSKGSGSNTHTASKNDREALERQIREQRLQFDERDLAEATARSARSSRGTQQSGALYFRQAVRSRYGMASSSTGSPFGAYSSSRLADPERTAGNDGAQTASTNGVDRTATTGSRNAGNMQFVSSLEGLLQTHGSTRITSIQQLEDMMLMEAIRLSMQESAPSPSTDSNNNNNNNNNNNTSSNTQSSLPVPPSPARLSPFVPLSPARSGSLRSTPVGRTTTSASSPFRAFLTTNEVRVDASNDETGRSSEDSGAAAQSEGDDEEGYEQEEEGLVYTYDSGVFGQYGRRSSEGGEGSDEEEEEDELDEEEQIRLAMELSLADMRATTTATTTTTTTGAATTVHSASNGNSATDTLCANTSMMNAASSIDTACVNPLGPIPNSDYSMKNTASEKPSEEEYVLKPHAEDTLPTATSSDALETEADTTNTTDTTQTTNTDTINRTSALLTKTDPSTDEKVSEESTVSPQAVFAEVRL